MKSENDWDSFSGDCQSLCFLLGDVLNPSPVRGDDPGKSGIVGLDALSLFLGLKLATPQAHNPLPFVSAIG